MKKINKLAAQDAARYIEANATISRIGDRFYADPAYAKAFDSAYSKIQANPTAIEVAKKMRTPTAVKLRQGAIIFAAVVILHETGYDEVLWNKAKSAGRYLRSKHRKVVAELKEEFPQTAEKVAETKDAIVDTAKTAASEAKAAGGYDPEMGYRPNIQENDASADR